MPFEEEGETKKVTRVGTRCQKQGKGEGQGCEGEPLTTAKAIARNLLADDARPLVPLIAETGGLNAMIVDSTALSEQVVRDIIISGFQSAGQRCSALRLLLLQEDIADEFLEKMTALTRQIVIGDPLAEETQMGPLCTTGQLENIQREVAHAQEQGATILAGGKQPDGMGGLFYEPTIIECPRQDLQIVDTELFGPVLSVQRFKTEEEVLKLANDSEHGLAAGIFTRDSARSLRMANAVQAGIVWVNTYRVVSPIAEFGGVKGSGYGRESGFQAIYDYTRPKTIWVNTSDEPISNPFVMR